MGKELSPTASVNGSNNSTFSLAGFVDILSSDRVFKVTVILLLVAILFVG